MSDLISRSVLIRAIVDTPTDCVNKFSVSSVYEGVAYGCATRQNEILDIIKEQPTAYNVGKVVAELEEKRQSLLKSYKEFLDGEDYRQALLLESVIEIVKKGGVDDEISNI